MVERQPPAHRHADDPVRKQRDRHRHTGVLQAAQRTIGRHLDTVGKLEQARQHDQLRGQRDDPWITRIQRRDVVREAEHQAGRKQLRHQRQANAAETGVAHPTFIATSHRIADPYRDGHGQPKRNHEEQRGNVDRHLMAGNHLFAQRADDQRRSHEQTSLRQQRHRHRQTDMHQCANTAQIRPLEAVKQVQPAIVAVAPHIDAEPTRLQPQRQRRGHAATVRALRGNAKLAKHQHITQRHEHQQAAETEIHRRPRQRQAF